MVQAKLANVADDPDDLRPMLAAVIGDALADGIFVGPELALHGFVDQDHDRSLVVIILGKQPALLQRDLQRLEIVRRNRGEGGDRRSLPRLDRAALNFKGKGNALLATRNELRIEGIAIGNRDTENAGLGLQAVQEFGDEKQGLLVGGVLGKTESGSKRENTLRYDPGFHLLHLEQAAEHEAGANQQHEGEGHLADDKSAAHAILPASSSRGGAAFLQAHGKIRAREQSGKRAKDDAGAKGGDEGEQQPPGGDLDFVRAGSQAGSKIGEQMKALIGQIEAQESADERE